MTTPKLSFERWNDLSSQARHLSEDDFCDLLEREEVSSGDYRQAEMTYPRAIAAALAAGDSRLADARIARVRRADADAAKAPSFEMDETLPIPAASPLRPAVPFAGTTTADKVMSQFVDELEPGDAQSGETSLLPQLTLVSPQTGTFRDKLGQLAIPTLSLDEYAELQARVSLFGETDVATLARFGVSGRDALTALRARFAAYFLRDQVAQRTFLETLQRLMVELSKEHDRSSR